MKTIKKKSAETNQHCCVGLVEKCLNSIKHKWKLCQEQEKSLLNLPVYKLFLYMEMELLFLILYTYIYFLHFLIVVYAYNVNQFS